MEAHEYTLLLKQQISNETLEVQSKERDKQKWLAEQFIEKRCTMFKIKNKFDSEVEGMNNMKGGQLDEVDELQGSAKILESRHMKAQVLAQKQLEKEYSQTLKLVELRNALANGYSHHQYLENRILDMHSTIMCLDDIIIKQESTIIENESVGLELESKVNLD